MRRIFALPVLLVLALQVALAQSPAAGVPRGNEIGGAYRSAGPAARERRARMGAEVQAALVTDMAPMGNPRIKPVLVAEPLGPAKACR